MEYGVSLSLRNYAIFLGKAECYAMFLLKTCTLFCSLFLPRFSNLLCLTTFSSYSTRNVAGCTRTNVPTLLLITSPRTAIVQTIPQLEERENRACKGSGLKGNSIPCQRTTKREERKTAWTEEVICVLGSGPNLY